MTVSSTDDGILHWWRYPPLMTVSCTDEDILHHIYNLASFFSQIKKIIILYHTVVLISVLVKSLLVHVSCCSLSGSPTVNVLLALFFCIFFFGLVEICRRWAVMEDVKPPGLDHHYYGQHLCVNGGTGDQRTCIRLLCVDGLWSYCHRLIVSRWLLLPF